MLIVLRGNDKKLIGKKSKISLIVTKKYGKIKLLFWLPFSVTVLLHKVTVFDPKLPFFVRPKLPLILG